MNTTEHIVPSELMPLQTQTVENNASRREFLRTTLAATVIGMVGGVAEVLGEVLPDDFKERGSQLHGIYTLRFADFPALRTVGGSIRLQVPGSPLSLGQIIVTRFQANSFAAVSELCTHDGCSIGDYNHTAGLFTCPCHGAQYNAQGTVVRRAPGAQHGNLRSYTTMFTMGNDFVQIDVPGLATSVKADTQFTSSLSQNFPNPATTSTIIEYSVARESLVTIGLYSILGKEIMEILRKEHEAGQYRVTADVSNLNKGVYFYRMDTNIGFSQTRKLTVV
jgi:nitrite reductase/ring-hydroxylating ferredoxin subunit